MGRPPIGKIAMTGAERVRRYRERQRAETPVTKHVTKQDERATARIAALEAELRAAKARIRQLSTPRLSTPERRPKQAREQELEARIVELSQIRWRKLHDKPWPASGNRPSSGTAYVSEPLQYYDDGPPAYFVKKNKGGDPRGDVYLGVLLDNYLWASLDDPLYEIEFMPGSNTHYSVSFVWGTDSDDAVELLGENLTLDEAMGIAEQHNIKRNLDV